MGADAMQLLEGCIEQLKQGKLTEAHLRDLGSAIATDSPKQQHLLYLQTATTAVTSEVIGMLMVKDGAVSDGPIRLCRLALQNRSGCDQRRLARYPVSGSVARRSHPRHTYHL